MGKSWGPYGSPEPGQALWFLVIVIFVAAVLLGVLMLPMVVTVAHGAYQPITNFCDSKDYQAYPGWECIEYLETYGPTAIEDPDMPRGIGMVYVNDELRHSSGGYNQPWQLADYTYEAVANTAEEYTELVVCPDIQDGIEAMEDVALFATQRMALDTKGRA